MKVGSSRASRKYLIVFWLVLSVTFAACLPGAQRSAYYGKVVVPRVQEFRWSDGGLPQTFDPAFAAAPPDTDAVRALFEGLTDYDPQTLAPVPGVATHWESSVDGRVWTFYLRQDAKWSNGESVTASDFVRSWERTLKIGPLAPHTELLANIQGSGVNPVAVKGSTPTQHVFAGIECAHNCLFDWAVSRNCSHLQVVRHYQMLITQLFAQQFSNDGSVKRSRFQKATRGFLFDVDVGKATMANHYAAYAIVSTLKQLDVRREILCNQIVVRKSDDRHLFMRVDLAGSDSRKMFQAAKEPGTL